MKTIRRFPFRFTETEDCWIPMPDGVRLAAKLWMPRVKAGIRVPAIIEVLPYRKRDIYAPRDAMHHRYFAGHGYACLRVDIRGSGDSDGHQGVFAAEQERNDTLRVLEWIAAQSWSDGQVAMFGISWGGFQGIQTAHCAPPQLKAVVACSFAPDRYRYSQAYRGGCFLPRSIRWSSQLFGYKSRPPDPALVGRRWRRMWLERLEHDTPQIIAALEHQAYDAYWQRLRIDYARIRAPFYAISGWADGAYVSAVGESLAALPAPHKGLIGPWGHRFPHLGVPGPAIGFLQESLRWFDHWMRDRDTGVMREPMLKAWIAEAAPAQSFYAQSPGRWVTEPVWPSPRIKTQRWYLQGDGSLRGRARTRVVRSARSPLTTGLDCGELMPWFQHGPSPEMPGDQRADDGKSLCFDSAPLARATEILGTPVARLRVAVDRPTAFICVRLCDVAPDGASTRVSYGVFNLTHVDDPAKPIRLEPGRRYDVTVPLVDTGYAFRKGHRIRVAVSTSYWPLIWPSPEPVTLALDAGISHLELPVRPPNPADRRLREFEAPEAAEPFTRTVLEPGGRSRAIRTDVGSGETVVEIADFSGRLRYDDIALVAEARSSERYRLVEGDPLSATAEVGWTWRFERGNWRIRTESMTRVSCTRTEFVVHARLDAYEGSKRVFSREFDHRVRRHGT
ncbi:MAG: CocE/NonD family hydrolase [Proteobacteria bacterium]|nr:CocE/NonD family hydrolase [Burkholderiales bacterium]